MKKLLVILILLLAAETLTAQQAWKRVYVDTLAINSASKSPNRAFIFLSRDTIYAKLYPDSLVLQNVIGDTTWMNQLIPRLTSGQNAWFKRNALAPQSGTVSLSTATDTLLVKTFSVKPATNTGEFRVYDVSGTRYSSLWHYDSDDLRFSTSVGSIVLLPNSGKTTASANTEGQGFRMYRAGGANSGSELDFYREADNQGIRFYQTVNLATAAKTVYMFNVKSATGGALTASSGVQTWMSLEPTINQTSTAGFTALNVNVTKTAFGSGTNNLLNLQIGGASKFRVSDSGYVNGSIIKSGLQENLFLGVRAGDHITTGYGNIGIGFRALEVDTSGYSNVAIGAYSLAVNRTGSDIIAIGNTALENNLTGNDIIAIGKRAMSAHLSNGGSIAIGTDALGRDTTGGSNVAIGGDAQWWGQGSSNSSLGSQTFWYITSGSFNSAIGRDAGSFKNLSDTVLTYVDSTTFIGAKTNASKDSVRNSTALGFGATVTKNNQMVFGNTAVTENVFHGKTIIGTGMQFALRTITAGDSIYGHTILDAADSTIKMWNGTAWKTIADTR